jgi:nucleotidyltransferase substrate binding protein (TIGR01987 family)
MTVDITSLEKAVQRLTEGLARAQQSPADDQLRDGLIQRFEFTYELSHKTLKRYLESISATPAQYDAMPFQDLIRSGNEVGLLLSDWPAWRQFRELRSMTSHTYNEAKALQVARAIPAFLAEAQHLLTQLRQRL